MPTPSVRQTPNWHGHVTAVTCAPSHRRLGLAAKLMSALEEISEKKHCFFVDLFVRVSNLVAINMYKALYDCIEDEISNVIYNIMVLYFTQNEPMLLMDI